MKLPANASHMAKLNQQLACINGCTMSCAKLLAGMELPKNSERLQVFVSKNMDAEIIEAVSALATVQTPVFWIIPVLSADAESTVSIPNVRTFLWEVKL